MNLSTTGLKLAADSAVDLHLHTTYSDGRWELEPLLDHLRQEQFDLVAITDHDRTDKVEAIQELALDKNLPVLVAVEMTTTWKGEMTDLLCYGFDLNYNAMTDLAQEVSRRQSENTREVCENIRQQGYTLSPEKESVVLAKPSSQQPHELVDTLLELGNDLDRPSVGRILTEAGCKFETNAPAAVVEAAHKSGAVCLLAHPGRGDGFKTYDVQLLNEFRQEAPIDGLEVYYPAHSPAQTAMYLEYVQRHKLLSSAGSDSHSPDKPPIKYRAELIRDLLERVGVKVE